MPTNHDESPLQRQERDHQSYLVMLAKMTPEQIAGLELQLHNALAELDAERQRRFDGNEASSRENAQLSAEVERLREALRLAGHWCKSALKCIEPAQSRAQSKGDTIHDLGCFLRHQSRNLDAALAGSEEAG